MKCERSDPEEGRAETDASLGIERAAADAAISRAVANAERKFDGLIARDRVIADESMTRFRQSADDLLAGERSAAPTASCQVVEERLAADDSKAAERSAMDAVLEHERQRVDELGETRRETEAIAHNRHDAERQSTDENLSTERSEADAVAADRDASESALEAALSAEVDRAEVLAMVTHDLRNPLLVILGNADIIVEGSDSPFAREAATDITRAAARMGRLLTDLLDLARIDADAFRLDRQAHSVPSLLSEMRQSYRPVFESRGLTLSVDVPSADFVASFDHDRIVQLLSNLLGNTMKFTSRGGHVELWVEQNASELVFAVRDDGVGIEASAVSHLFERFWQRDTDKRRGLGLGLYLCRTIAEAHGGDISVQSEVGVGSTFRVCFPRVE